MPYSANEPSGWSSGCSTFFTPSAPTLFFLIATVLGDGWEDVGLPNLLFVVAMLIPSLAVTFRRLHDTDHSGWWLLIGFVPIIGMMILLIVMVQDSQAGANQYGPNPKGWRA